MSREVEQLKKEVAKLRDAVSDLQLATKSIDHDLQSTKREMKGK